MQRAEFRFYAELNDFLPPARRFLPIPYFFDVGGPVKDVIEGLGVPHTEVDLVLANGVSVDFSYIVRDGDRISVYPVFEAIDITPLVRVRPQPLREPRFILDVHLGRLAAYLRMLGLDTLYRNDSGDEELARISSEEGRILLTRDRHLLKRRAVQHGYCIRETNPQRQLLEVVRRFDLSRSAAPFERCLRCNTVLEPAPEESLAGRLPERARLLYSEFYACSGCGRAYWKGSHYRRMQRLLREALPVR
jgi:uncharacterized protein with PIN domain